MTRKLTKQEAKEAKPINARLKKGSWWILRDGVYSDVLMFTVLTKQLRSHDRDIRIRIWTDEGKTELEYIYNPEDIIDFRRITKAEAIATLL